MKFFKDPKNWRSELAAIGLAAGSVLFFLSFFVLGNPNVWLLVSCIPLLLPLFFGSWLKMKLPALLFLVLAGWISFGEITRYMSYCNPRVPIYQTEMTDFELHVQGGETAELRAAMQRESQEFVEKLKIKTLRCFLFRGHANRPIYCIVVVGSIPPDTDIPGSMQKALPLKRNPWVLSALQLSGADVREEDLCRKWIPDPFFAGQVYVCRDRIVFYTAAANPTFLFKETDKRAFLEKYISPKKK